MGEKPQPRDTLNRRENSAGIPSPTAMIDDKGLAEQVGRYLLCLPETFAWYTWDTYEGHSLKRKGNGWFLVVRCRQKGVPMVCFNQGDTIGRVFQMFAIGIANDVITWHPDRYD